MGRLIVLRHAKSDWGVPGLADHDRPLNARGRKAAARIGDWLREHGRLPDTVLCSTAARTVETLERTGIEADIRLVRELYHAEAPAILDVLRRADGETVMIVGHNPGIGEFASRIVAVPPGHPRFADFPTAACLVTDLPEPWREADFQTGLAVDFAVPRDLD